MADETQPKVPIRVASVPSQELQGGICPLSGLQQRDVHQLLGAQDLQDLLGMVTQMSLKISSQVQRLLQQTNEILEEAGDVVRTLHLTFLPSLGFGHIPVNILHRFCCCGQQELFGGTKKSPCWSESHKTGLVEPLRAQLQPQGMVRVCPCTPGGALSRAEHEGTRVQPQLFSLHGAAEPPQQLSCKPCIPGRAFWAHTAPLGVLWGAGRRRAPASPPFSPPRQCLLLSGAPRQLHSPLSTAGAASCSCFP